MKIFLLDEVYEFAKSVGITDKINALAKKMYDPSTIQSDYNHTMTSVILKSMLN